MLGETAVEPHRETLGDVTATFTVAQVGGEAPRQAEHGSTACGLFARLYGELASLNGHGASGTLGRRVPRRRAAEPGGTKP